MVTSMVQHCLDETFFVELDEKPSLGRRYKILAVAPLLWGVGSSSRLTNGVNRKRSVEICLKPFQLNVLLEHTGMIPSPVVPSAQKTRFLKNMEQRVALHANWDKFRMRNWLNVVNFQKMLLSVSEISSWDMTAMLLAWMVFMLNSVKCSKSPQLNVLPERIEMDRLLVVWSV